MPSIELDLHTHTIASGHGSASTITDMAKTAALRGLRILGISDHGPATFGGGKPSYFRSLSQARRKRLGVEMLYGAEVNILDQQGSLYLDDSVLAHLDYVIASMHRSVKKPGTKEENTAAYIAAMHNPFVCILGHCDDVKYPIDPLAVVKTAIERQVLLEINDSSLRPDGYRGDTRFHDLMLPKVSMACFTTLPTTASLSAPAETSACTARTRIPYNRSSSSFASSSFFTFRPVITRFAPSFA